MPRPEDIVELTSRPGGLAQPTSSSSASTPRRNAPEAGAERPFLRLWFACSSQYARAYKFQDGSAYAGRCPTCHKCIRFPVGQGGTSQRSFTVSCQ